MSKPASRTDKPTFLEILNRFIAVTDRGILQDAGKVSTEIAKTHAEREFEKYRIIQDRLFESDFDKQTKALEKKLAHMRHSCESRNPINNGGGDE